MADNKSNRGSQDRARVASGQQYEVKYFARKHRLSMADARAVLQRAGVSRDKANQLAEKERRN